MPDSEALLTLADTWEKAAARARGKKRDDVATALIGCAQALRNEVQKANG